jgi:hypothetical protein
MTDDSVALDHRLDSSARIDEMDDEMTTVDMPEKLKSESLPLARTLDESWYILDHERSVSPLHDTQIGDECREWIGRDLGFHICDRLYDSGFASIGESDESDIGDELEFESDLVSITRISELSKVGRLACRRREVRIAKSSSPPLTEDELLTCDREITDDRVILYISHDRPDWYLEYGVLSIGSVHFLCPSLATIVSLDQLQVTKFHECRLMCRRSEDDIASATTIATEWSSLWDIFLASPWDDAVPSFSGFTGDFYFVDEHFEKYLDFRC